MGRCCLLHGRKLYMYFSQRGIAQVSADAVTCISYVMTASLWPVTSRAQLLLDALGPNLTLTLTMTLTLRLTLFAMYHGVIGLHSICPWSACNTACCKTAVRLVLQDRLVQVQVRLLRSGSDCASYGVWLVQGRVLPPQKAEQMLTARGVRAPSDKSVPVVFFGDGSVRRPGPVL